MKPVFALTAVAAVMTFISCGPSAEEIAAQKEKAVQDSIAAAASMEHTWTIDPAASKLTWAGTMIGVKTHTGVMNITSGSLLTKGNTVTGGDFLVNLKMEATALTDTFYAPDGSKQGTKDNLLGHLMSPDFFAVDSFPTATFKITSVTANTATGDLTVHGKTNSETVTDIVVTTDASGAKASGKLVFNRQKYGLIWDSGSKDYVLSDDITLNVELVGIAN